MREDELRGAKFARNITYTCILGLFVLIGGGMAGCPQYNVWSEGLAGKAELRRAEENRQIKIEEAKAIEESAGSLANAEVIRAEGVAKANKIVQAGLGGPQGYLRYLYIEGLKEHGKECPIIYVPTEAALPILEARTPPR